MVRQLEVKTLHTTYPILIGPGLLSHSAILKSYLSSEILVVTNATIAPLHLKTLQNALPAHQVQLIPDGEVYKTLETLGLIFDKLIHLKYSRKSTLIALGGGVIGDTVGFAAACYQRGVHYIQIPTTLLAAVDSSVGGKTAINHPGAKNMIGAFYQPRAVLIDTLVLQTLPSREYISGLSEVLKYGLIRDAHFFEWLESQHPKIIQRDPSTLAALIAKCCEIKANIIEQDEHDKLGIRSLLNLGHTFGHALENIMGYGQLLHGEAVSIGIMLSLKYSQQLGWISEHLIQRTEHWLTTLGLPTQLPSISLDLLCEALLQDKKKSGSQLYLILVDQLGHAVEHPVSLAEIRNFLERLTPQG